MEIQVINLDRSKDRMLAFDAINAPAKLAVQRFPAIEGKNADRGAQIERGIITADLGYGDGALGCALSHLALWDRAIEKNETLTICEDDAIFNQEFASAADTVLKTLPPGWHIILWGWNFDSILLFEMLPGVSPCLGAFDQDRMRMGIDAFQSAVVAPQPYRLFRAFGAVGYSITPAGAQALKQHCLPMRKMDVFIPGLGRAVPNSGIDVMLNDVYPRIKAYVSFPPLVITRNLHSISTIQKSVL
jgi:glycosyl transferase, family 25